jgi:hypothetical protein
MLAMQGGKLLSLSTLYLRWAINGKQLTEFDAQTEKGDSAQNQ